MKAKLISVLVLLTALFTAPAYARQEPIVNIENAAITTTSGKTPTLAEVKQSIIVAGAPQGWQVTDTGNGTLIASLTVRGKHFATVEIPYTTKQYSVIYKSSVNLNYSIVDDVPVIHPYYNKWVQTFNSNIHAELLKR